MNQQINLLLAIPVRQKEKLSATHIAQLCLAFFIVLMVIYSYGQTHHFWLKHRFEQLVTREKAAADRLIALELKYPEIAKQSAKGDRASRLAKEIQAKQELVAVLSTKHELNVSGLSQYLAAFAKQIIPDVWLRRISIKGSGKVVELEGYATQAPLALQFTNNLNKDPLFKGQPFKLSGLEEGDKEDQPASFSTSNEKQEK